MKDHTPTMPRRALLGLMSLAAFGLTPQAQAQWRRPGRRAAEAPSATGPAGLPPGVREIENVAYGPDARERMDIYLPEAAHPRPAPVIFMVHGGAWRFGDKTAASVVANKVARWVPRGLVLISVDYPMLPQAPVSQQAHSVALALAAAQRRAAEWGANADQFILMGHSAGAHLVALLNARPAYALDLGARPWLGAVALDSAALNVAAIMQRRHMPFYNEAFGSDPAYWARVSPIAQLVQGSPPYLLVCSSLRQDSCPQAQAMASKVQGLGGRAQVLPQALKHNQIDAELGLESAYTRAVEDFMASLDPAVARLLRP